MMTPYFSQDTLEIRNSKSGGKGSSHPAYRPVEWKETTMQELTKRCHTAVPGVVICV